MTICIRPKNWDAMYSIWGKLINLNAVTKRVGENIHMDFNITTTTPTKIMEGIYDLVDGRNTVRTITEV